MDKWSDIRDWSRDDDASSGLRACGGIGDKRAPVAPGSNHGANGIRKSSADFWPDIPQKPCTAIRIWQVVPATDHRDVERSGGLLGVTCWMEVVKIDAIWNRGDVWSYQCGFAVGDSQRCGKTRCECSFLPLRSLCFTPKNKSLYRVFDQLSPAIKERSKRIHSIPNNRTLNPTRKHPHPA